MKHVIKTTSTIVVLASLAMMAQADQTHKHKTKKVKATVKQDLALSQPSPELAPMIGTWTLRNGDKPRTDIKMIFRPDGTFAFVGSNWQSKGHFKLGEHKLCLEWSSVDGSAVAPGSMKKDFPMADDNSSFTIDQYTYFKFTPGR